MRDLRKQSNVQLEEKSEAHRRAVEELEHLLGEERKRGQEAAAATGAQISQLQSELGDAHEKMQASKETRH